MNPTRKTRICRAPPRLVAPDSALPDAPPGVRVHSSFEPVDNVAVTALETRPLVTDPTRYQAFVQVFNASPGAHRVQLVIEGINILLGGYVSFVKSVETVSPFALKPKKSAGK